MYLRNISSNIITALSDTPVVLLNGARQTGKSTLVKWLASNRHPAHYLTLDDASVLSAASSDPAGFLAGLKGPVVLDEVQHAPDLFQAIKTQVDRDRRPGRFLLTGSANVMLLPRLSESLAGRMEILTLWPFSQGEIEAVHETFIDAVFLEEFSPSLKNSREPVVERILTGGFPEILQRKTFDRRNAWFASYITTILQRDVRDLANIDGLTTMPRLLGILGARAGTLLNLSDLSRSTGIPQTTLKRYMVLLETIFLVHFLPAWSANLNKRLVKSPKVILSDTGLLGHLQGLTPERISQNPQLMGPVLENFVVMELKKQMTWSRIRPQIFHFRTQTGHEVDILLEDTQDRIVGIEVKAGSTVGSKDFASLRVLAESLGKRFCRGIVLYCGSEIVPFGSNFHAVPVPALWG